MRILALIIGLFAAAPALAEGPYCGLPQSEWDTILAADIVGEWNASWVHGATFTTAGPFPSLDAEDVPMTIYVDGDTPKALYRDNIHDVALVRDTMFDFDDLRSLEPFPSDVDSDLREFREFISNDELSLISDCIDTDDLPQFTLTGTLTDHPAENDLRLYFKMALPDLALGIEHLEVRRGGEVFSTVSILIMNRTDL